MSNDLDHLHCLRVFLSSLKVYIYTTKYYVRSFSLFSFHIRRLHCMNVCMGLPGLKITPNKSSGKWFTHKIIREQNRRQKRTHTAQNKWRRWWDKWWDGVYVMMKRRTTSTEEKKVALKQEKVVMARGLPLSRLSHDNYIHFYFYLENYVRSLSSYRQLHSIPSDA